MPFVHRTNNRVLPANSRAVDVAKQSLREIMPIQQRRYHNAFEVQGFEAIVYTRLKHGLACSCQAHSKALATYLGEDGKMAPGTLNELLTGGMEFSIQDYGTKMPERQDIRAAQGKQTRDNEFFAGIVDDDDDIVHEYVVGEAHSANKRLITPAPSEGANGPDSGLDLDDLAKDFESTLLDASTTRCGICLGVGFVGGFSVLNGYRNVLSTRSPELDRANLQGTIEINTAPHSFFTTRAAFNVVLPKGFVSLDAFKIWNNTEQVTGADLTLDGLPFSQQLLIALCDGRPHLLVVAFEELSTFTHIEIQINLSHKLSLIEFPRLNKTSNMNVNDMTGDVTLNASPLIPQLTTLDVVVESTYGKGFIVSDANWWNDKDRNVLGWDVEARVLQPEEILSNLPRRRKMGQRTTNMVRDNVSGIRRT